MTNKKVLKQLPFHNNDTDNFFKKPKIKKDIVIKPKPKYIRSSKRKNKYKKSNVFKYTLPFNNDYVNRNLLKPYLFIIMKQKGLKEGLKIISVLKINKLED